MNLVEKYFKSRKTAAISNLGLTKRITNSVDSMVIQSSIIEPGGTIYITLSSGEKLTMNTTDILLETLSNESLSNRYRYWR